MELAGECDCGGCQDCTGRHDLTLIVGSVRHDRYRLQIACRGDIAFLRELCASQTVLPAR